MRVPRVGEEFAGYRIEAVLGRGGMGIVYRAEHLELERKVALKLLAEALSEDETFRKRFIRESKLAASMDHPNVIPIYGAGDHDGLLFIAMRYVDGSDLKQVIKQEGSIDPARSLFLLEQAASALDAAHSRELVHRDVKPHNMLIATSAGFAGDHVYLSDFGLAKHVTSRTEITATGTFMGTVDYVAPEQIEGKSATPASDVYSLGCVLFECLTGSVPFPGDTDMAVAHAHLSDTPPQVTTHRDDLPSGLDKVVAQALAKSPEERYATCGEIVSAARTVFEASGFDLHRSSYGSGPRSAIRQEGTRPPSDSPLQTVDPVAGAQEPASLGTMSPPNLEPDAHRPAAMAPAPLGPAWQQTPQLGTKRPRRWGLLVGLLFLLALVGAGVAYFLLQEDEGGGGNDNEKVTFVPRASAEFPGRLLKNVGPFELIVPRPDKLDPEPGATDELAGLYKNEADQQIFHSVIQYEEVEQAEAERQSEIDTLVSKGFEVIDEVPTKRALGGKVGTITLLRQSKDDLELEAVVWTNETLAVTSRGPQGAAVDFFSELAY